MIKKIILTVICLSYIFATAQKISFENRAIAYFNPEDLKIRFSEFEQYVFSETYDAGFLIGRYDIMKMLSPIIDSVEYYRGHTINNEMQQKAFPLMKNLKAIYLEGNWKLLKTIPYRFSSEIQSLQYNTSEFSIPFDLQQMSGSLRILNIEAWTKVKEPFHFDFSSFDSLEYLKFIMKSCKSSDYKIKFSPHLYCLEWTVNPNHPDIPIPPTVEILFLRMENDSYPPMLYKLPNLKFLSVVSFKSLIYAKYRRISLPEELITIPSLKSLEITRLTKKDIEIISQMENLDTLYIYDIKKKLPPNIGKLKGLTYIELHSYEPFWYSRKKKPISRIVGGKMKAILPDVVIYYRTASNRISPCHIDDAKSKKR